MQWIKVTKWCTVFGYTRFCEIWLFRLKTAKIVKKTKYPIFGNKTFYWFPQPETRCRTLSAFFKQREFFHHLNRMKEEYFMTFSCGEKSFIQHTSIIITIRLFENAERNFDCIVLWWERGLTLTLSTFYRRRRWWQVQIIATFV